MDEEREFLEAAFDADFEVLDELIWRVKIAGTGAALRVVLPAGYPEQGPPRPALEFDAWPAWGDAFSARVAAELSDPAKWVPGEGCVFQWVDIVRERLDGADTGEVAPAGGVAATPAALEAQEASAAAGPAQAAVPLATGAAEAVGRSLETAGFQRYGEDTFSHGDRGVTVEFGAGGAELLITVDGVDAEDLGDWARMQLETDVEGFGARLLTWVTAQRSAEPGFAEEEGAGDEDAGGLEYLPSAAQLGVDSSRELLIYTWGKAIRKAAPGDSECNFNAGILNGRGGGADLRTMNGLDVEVQNNVASCGLFPRWVEMVCSKIEGANLHTISINCTKGRHRSVAAAMILQKIYYPAATTKHLTIY